MNQREFIKELHDLYLEDITQWMTDRFEERGIDVEDQSEAQEKAMLRAILKHDGMDYDYLEWAAEGNEEGSTYAEQLECLAQNQEWGGPGVLSGRWESNNDEEDEKIFSRYKKYFKETMASEIKNALKAFKPS